MPLASIRNLTRPLAHEIRVPYADSFITRLRGLMFRRSLARDDGLLLKQARDDRLDAAIHMFFVPFDLAVIWIDSHMRVVDMTRARPWRPFYMPSRAARYVLEIHPDRLADFQVGDQVVIEDVALA